MSRGTFIDYVLAPTGYICIFGLTSDKSLPVVQKFFTTLEEAEETIALFAIEQRETYFACATFKDGNGKRNVKNIALLKSFFIDIDCGYNKPYENKKAGLQALSEFLEETRLPMPTLVDSGNGIHAYWTLEEPITYNDWRPVADGLKRLTEKLRFEVDPAVTSDGARILRLPDTYNYKDRGNPKKVSVIQYAAHVNFEAFRTLCGVFDAKNAPLDENDPVLKSIKNGQIECKFGKIVKKSIEKNAEGGLVACPNGCAQIADIVINQATTGEERWRGGLSIARHCVDWEEYIHKISYLHPKYTPEETEEKAEGTLVAAPYTCRKFQSMKPDLCLSCPHRGKFGSPIALGVVIAEAKPEDNLLEGVWHKNVKDFVEVDIPVTYPRPWIRPKTGGIAIKGLLQALPGNEEEADSEPQEMLVYSNDLWVKGRIDDPQLGEMILIAHILPRDGMREFTVPLAEISKKDKCQGILAAHGVAAIDKRMDLIRRYITDWTAYMQQESKAAQARVQFGWHDNNTKFIIGAREICTDGAIVYSPPSSATEDVAEIYTKKGQLEPWKRVINSYGAVGNEPRAFALFAGFGSAIYKFLNLPSPIIHLTNAASGVGKSTAQMAANSIWGHPQQALLNENDTHNARLNRTGILNNIVVTFDEITNITAEEASDFVFTFSQNRGKHRMQAQANVERRNKTTWATIGITSGNNSLYDVIRAFKAASEGEMYRIMEVPIDMDTHLTKEESDYLFHDLLLNNYGLAGEMFIQYVIGNLESVMKRMKAYMVAFDSDAGFRQKERYYSGCCAASMVAGEITYELGLHNIDVQRVRQWAIDTFANVKKEVVKHTEINSMQVLAEFLNEINRSIAVVRGDLPEVDGRILPDASAYMPSAELIGRYEPDTHLLYIATHKLREWATNRRMPFNMFQQQMTDDGFITGVRKMQLGKGTRMPGARIDTIVLDAEKLGVAIDIPPQSL